MLFPKENFIILGHARSGSSTLKQIIESQNISVFGEPFNSEVTQKYLNLLKLYNINFVIKDIFNEYCGIKHLVHQLNVEKNSWLIGKYPIVFLKRKNLLQAATSSVLALQTRIWSVDNLVRIGGREAYYANLPALDIELIKKRLKEFKKDIDFCQNLLKKHHNVWYEDLYSDNWKEIISDIFKFIKLPVNNWNSIESLVKNNKLNDIKAYNNILNIEEIKLLGSSENGFI